MTTLPRHIVWSTSELDLDDPFQRRWYIRQVMTHGRAEDVSRLDMDEVSDLLDELDLPPDLYRLWRTYLEARRHA